ncbi:type II secretion system protein N [Desulfothermus okinawensis]
MSLDLLKVQNKNPELKYIKNINKRYNLKLDNIVKKNIFNVIKSIKIKDSNKNIENSIEDIPVANIKDLELRGIIWSNEKEKRIAVIYDKKIRLEGLYSIGDKLSGGMLKDILKNQIIVTINNKDSRIPLTDYTELEKGVSFSKESIYVVSKDVLKSKLSNMPSLLRSMRVVPYTSNGIKGFRVVSIRDRFIRNRLGLRRGDIILGVNGKQVVDMANIMQLYGKIQNIDHVELEILRNGERKILSYSIK